MGTDYGSFRSVPREIDATTRCSAGLWRCTSGCLRPGHATPGGYPCLSDAADGLSSHCPRRDPGPALSRDLLSGLQQRGQFDPHRRRQRPSLLQLRPLQRSLPDDRRSRKHLRKRMSTNQTSFSRGVRNWNHIRRMDTPPLKRGVFFWGQHSDGFGKKRLRTEPDCTGVVDG